MPINLFIDTVSQTLVQAIAPITSVIPATALAFYYGDSPTVNVYLLQRNYVAGQSGYTYSSFQATGSLTVALDDGLASGTVYTEQTAWTFANGCYTGVLPLNTTNLTTLLAGVTSANCWIKVGYTTAGAPTTVLSDITSVGIGLPAPVIVPIPGQTAMTIQAADQRYLLAVNPPGAGFVLTSPNGVKMMFTLTDNPDNTATLTPQVLP